jgi:hypothetical protein
MGFKESAKGESPTAPLVMEMARVVTGQKGDDTSIQDKVSLGRKPSKGPQKTTALIGRKCKRGDTFSKPATILILLG